jgi:hypothetical protein
MTVQSGQAVHSPSLHARDDAGHMLRESPGPSDAATSPANREKMRSHWWDRVLDHVEAFDGINLNGQIIIFATFAGLAQPCPRADRLAKTHREGERNGRRL